MGNSRKKNWSPRTRLSHHVATALKLAERAFDVVKQFDREFYRRRLEAEKLKTGAPD